jgi:hypothetical protein
MCADFSLGVLCEVNKNAQYGDHVHPAVYDLAQ